MELSPQIASFSYDQPAISAFGDDIAAPRPLYFAYFPALLLLAGVLSWGMGNETGFVLACVTATIVFLYTLFEWMFRRAPTRFSTLLGMSLLGGYGAGALNTWLTLPRGSLTLGAQMAIGEGVLARGIAAVLFSAAALYFLGEIFERPLFGQSFHLQIDPSIRSVVYLGAVGMLIGYVTHSLAIGNAAASRGHISIPGMFLMWLYPSVASLSVPSFLTAEKGREKILSGMAALVLLLLFSVLGRRASVYTTMEVIFVLGLTGYKWRGRGLRSTLLIAFLGGVIVVGGLAFMILRIAPMTRAEAYQQQTLAQRIVAASKLVKQGNALALAAEATRQNVRSRTFVIAFLANVLDASSTRTPALGKDALNLIVGTIPSALYPNKDLFFSEEMLVDQTFGFGYGDEANSILTAGATDFGLVGMIVYPLLLVILARLIYGFLSLWLNPIALLFIALGLIFLFLQTEIVLTGYVSDFRNDIIFGILMQIFFLLPRFRLHPTFVEH